MNLAEVHAHSLELPLHKRMQRLETRNFISFCEKDYDKAINQVLLGFAKLDYNIVLALHQLEINELTMSVHYNR